MACSYNTLLTCSALVLITASSAQAQVIDYSQHLDVAIAYNSNAYRTPDGTYIDWGQATNPVINPNIQSGFFIPLKYKLAGSYPVNSRTALKGGLDLGGKFYLDSDLTNANERKYKLDFGAAHTISGRKRHTSSIEGTLFINSVDKTYYDRDTGLEKTAGITDVADRYSYRGNGAQLRYKNRTSKIFRYSGGITIGSRDYTDTIANSQMDYSFTTLDAEINYQLLKTTTLSAGIGREVQDYDERPSRNLAGSLFASNPALEYTYLTVALGVRHKLTDHWSLYGSYKNVDRSDGWVHYNDYTAHKLKIRAVHKRDNIKTRLSVSTQIRDYPNALAFDKPISGVNVNNTYDTLSWSLSRELKQTRNRSLWGKVAYNSIDTNDLRYNYDRYIISAGYKWRY